MKPDRTHNFGTYFVTAIADSHKHLFQSEPMALLLIDTILKYRDDSKFHLHDFVIMPNHCHFIVTPAESLERAVQFIKGGYSFRVKKELKRTFEIWQRGFTDHRVRDYDDYLRCKEYLVMNPVRKGLCLAP